MCYILNCNNKNKSVQILHLRLNSKCNKTIIWPKKLKWWIKLKLLQYSNWYKTKLLTKNANKLWQTVGEKQFYIYINPLLNINLANKQKKLDHRVNLWQLTCLQNLIVIKPKLLQISTFERTLMWTKYEWWIRPKKF